MYTLKGKKGLESYITIILGLGVLITFIIIVALTSIYGEEHKDCRLVDFEITNACKNGKSIRFTVENVGENLLNLEINTQKSAEFSIQTNSKKDLEFSIAEESLVTLVPYLNYVKEGSICSGKRQKINSEVLTKC